MRTSFFTLIAIFSVLFAQANDLNDDEKKEKSKTSKTEFYKSLIDKNNLNILIQENKEKITTKKEFFTLLIKANGLQSKDYFSK